MQEDSDRKRHRGGGRRERGQQARDRGGQHHQVVRRGAGERALDRPRGRTGRAEGVDGGQGIVVSATDTRALAAGADERDVGIAECHLVGRAADDRDGAARRTQPGDGGAAVGGRDVGEHLLDAQRRRQPVGRARVVAGQQHGRRPSSRRA